MRLPTCALLFCIAAALFGCELGAGECEGNHDDSEQLGSFYLTDSSRTWFPDSAAALSFANKDSVVITFGIVTRTKSKPNVLIGTRGNGKCNGETKSFAYREQETITYESEEVAYSLILTRQPDLVDPKKQYSFHPDTAAMRKAGDLLRFYCGNGSSEDKGISVLASGSPPLDSYYRRTITLNNKTFSDVWEGNFSVVGYTSKVRTVFFRKGEGLIAYKLASGELWVKQ